MKSDLASAGAEVGLTTGTGWGDGIRITGSSGVEPTAEADSEDGIGTTGCSAVEPAAEAGSEDGICATGSSVVESEAEAGSEDGIGVASRDRVGFSEEVCTGLASSSDSGSVYPASEDEGSDQVLSGSTVLDTEADAQPHKNIIMAANTAH